MRLNHSTALFKRGAVFALLSGSCIAAAQIGGGGGGEPATPTAEIVVADRVRALRYSATMVSPWSNGPGTAYAEFQVSCEVTSVTGYTLDWGRQNGPYEWDAAWIPNDPPPMNGMLHCVPPESASTTAYAYSPGEYSVHCTVYWIGPNSSTYSTCAIWPPDGEVKRILAVGGPYNVEVFNKDEQLDVPSRNSDGSWHLQNFNYHPELAIDNLLPDEFTQQIQLGRAFVAWTQPDGTTFDWDVTAAAILNPELIDQTTTIIEIGATGQTAQAGIEAVLTYYVTDDGEQFGPFDSHSQEFPPPVVFAKGQVASNYYTFTGHQPASTVLHHTSSLILNQPYYSAKREYWYQLLNGNGDPLPGVWLQERFQVSGSYVWNGGDIQATQAVDNHGNPHAHAIGTNRADDPTAEPDVYTYTDASGVMKESDILRLVYPWAMYTYPGDALYDLPHEYWAGTKSTYDSHHGIQVGSFNFRLWTNEVGH